MKRKTAIFIIAWLSSIILTGVFVYAATPTTTFSIYGGNYPAAPNYTIFTDGTNTFAKDARGVIAYSGTDAATVINNAVNGFSSGTLFISAGTYELTTGILISGKDSFQIVGEGEATVLDVSTNAVTALNFTDSGTGWFNGLKDIRIVGDSVSYDASSTGVSMDNQNHFTLFNVAMEYLGTGFSIDDSYYLSSTAFMIYGCDTGVLLGSVNNAVFNGLTVFYCTGTGLTTTTKSNTGLHFIEPTFEHNGGNGINIEIQTKGLVITGGYFAHNTGYGVFISGASNVYPSFSTVIIGGYYTTNGQSIGVGRCNVTTISGVFSTASVNSGIEIGNYTSYFTTVNDCWLEDNTPIMTAAGNGYNITVQRVPQYP